MSKGETSTEHPFTVGDKVGNFLLLLLLFVCCFLHQSEAATRSFSLEGSMGERACCVTSATNSQGGE